MTNEELLQVEAIKAELVVLIELVEKATDGSYSFLIGGEALANFDTQKDDFESAIVVAVTAARDAKQTEFDDFTGTDV